MIILDTSGLLAYLDEDEPDHAVTAAVVDAESGPFILSPFVLAEVDYVVTRQFGVDLAIEFLGEVTVGTFELATFDDSDMAHAVGVAKQYRDLKIGITDASVVALAHRYGTTRLLTLDERHFRTVRPLSGNEAFTLAPLDSETGS